MRILLSTGLLLAGYLSSYAVPKDKSIAAYEAAQEKTNSEIEKQINGLNFVSKSEQFLEMVGEEIVTIIFYLFLF